MKLTLNLVVLILGMTLLSAQKTFKVYGVVQDFHNNTGLKNAKIKIGNQATLSNERGIFNLFSVAKGEYTLSASHPDCEDFSQKIIVDKDIYLRINLEHHIDEIETVVLKGAKKMSGSIVMKTLDKKIINQNASENLANILNQISGVNTLKTGNNISKPIIHGMFGSRISIINDGVKMAEQEWGVEHSPSVEPTSFERINIVKGSGILKYGGDAVGGIVLLESKLFPARDTIMGEVLLSGISSGKGGKIGLNLAKTWENKWFVRTAGAYQKLGDLYIPNHTLQNTGTESNIFNFSFGKRDFVQGFEVSYSTVSQNFGIFYGSHIGSAEGFYNAVNKKESLYLDQFNYEIINPKQEVRHDIVKIDAYKRFYGFGKLAFQYSFQNNHRKEYDIRRGELNNLPSMDLNLVTHQGKLEHLIEREHWQLESGIFGTFQENYPNPNTQSRRLIPDYFRYDTGVFSVFNFKINSKWKADAGIRYDFNRYEVYKYYDFNDWQRRFGNLFSQFEISESGSRMLTRPILNLHNISMNVGLNYKPSDNYDFKFNISRASRTPNPAELFADGLHHSAAIIERGDLRLKNEEVFQVSFSTEMFLNLLDGLQFELTPYLMYSQNFINQVPTHIENTNRGIFMAWSYQQNKARIFGLDSDLELKLNKNIKWNSRFSTLRGSDLTKNEPLILMMPTNFRNALEYNFENKSNLFLRFENEWVAKQNRFPITNLDFNMIENGMLVTRVMDISSTPKAYSIFHFFAGFNLNKNLTFNLKINNIFNTEYRDYLNRLRYFVPEQGRNLILTLKYNF